MIAGTGYFTQWIDPQTGEITRNGMVLVWTVPGDGIVLQVTGKIVFSADFGAVLFVAGPHDLVQGVDGDAVLCEALA